MKVHQGPKTQSNLKCNICPGGFRKPTFKKLLQLKKHITLAHKTNFFKNELIIRSFNGECVKGCGMKHYTWEEAILHVSIEHEQLFWALKHDKKTNYKRLVKKLFPLKFKNTFGLTWEHSIGKAKMKKDMEDGR